MKTSMILPLALLMMGMITSCQTDGAYSNESAYIAVEREQVELEVERVELEHAKVELEEARQAAIQRQKRREQWLLFLPYVQGVLLVASVFLLFRVFQILGAVEIAKRYIHEPGQEPMFLARKGWRLIMPQRLPGAILDVDTGLVPVGDRVEQARVIEREQTISLAAATTPKGGVHTHLHAGSGDAGAISPDKVFQFSNVMAVEGALETLEVETGMPREYLARITDKWNEINQDIQE